jgi:hypothetical protein
MLSGTAVALPALASGATTVGSNGGHNIVVEPIYATPGQAVYVTGTPKYSADTGFYGKICGNQTVTVTVTYYTVSGTVSVATTDIGKASGIIGMPEPVTIPANAQPTRVDLHYAEVQAYCQAGTAGSPTTFSSNPEAVTVSGAGPKATTTTATTAPSTPTTTPPATPSTTSTTTATITRATPTTPAVAEQLAQTGSDIDLMVWLGGSLTVMGGLLVAFDAWWRRRAGRGVQRR